MRYSLIQLLKCPQYGDEFILLCFEESKSNIPKIYSEETTQVNLENVIIGPMPEHLKNNAHPFLLSQCSSLGNPERNFEVEIISGILISSKLRSWYPILNGIPEIYPPHLRIQEYDFNFLQRFQHMIPPEIFDQLIQITKIRAEKNHDDPYKLAEINLMDKVENRNDFLGPGYVAPFYIGDLYHSAYLIKGFANALHLMNLNLSGFLLDSGCGYAWTTEWAFKMGIKSIGIDINRTYLEVARSRMGSKCPHLILGDVENLPIRDNICSNVLGFDAFHHIPDRKRAFKEYFRILKNQGRVILVEPNSSHRDAPQSVEVMRKYGILEEGMDYQDVVDYVRDCGFENPDEIAITLFSRKEWKDNCTFSEVFDRSFTGWGYYRIIKP